MRSSLQPPPSLQSLIPGLALAVALAAAATGLAALPWAQQVGLSALILAIVGGMLIGNTVYRPLQAACGPGVGLAKQRLLRLGIVLFGLRLTFQDIAAVGMAGVLVDAVMLCSTFALAFWLGRRWLGLDEQSVILIGAGSSICGAAAVLATEPVLKASADKVAVAVSTVVVFGTLAMFAYPLLYALARPWGPSEWAYGVFAGSTVHEVAQAVAAGRAVSETAASSAVITKMIRVMMLAPFLLLLSAFLARREVRGSRQQPGARQPLALPWFALGFLGVAGVHSLGVLPPALVQPLVALDNLLLATAMGALGLTTHLSAIRRAGAKPLLLASVLFAWLICGGALVNTVAGALLH
jgi:uncharacterized integral membrane protein (TIGR00698 family)